MKDRYFIRNNDHFGIIIDLDLTSFFSSSFSDLTTQTPRSLTSGNKKSVDNYLKLVAERFTDHNFFQRVEELYDIVTSNPSTFLAQNIKSLNMIDSQITDIMSAGEREGARKGIQGQF